MVNSFTSRNFPGPSGQTVQLVSSTETRHGSSATIFLKPASAVRNQTAVAGRSSSHHNGNKPTEFNVTNAENKEPNASTSRPHCWLGPIFIRQQCWPKQRLRLQTGLLDDSLQVAQNQLSQSLLRVLPANECQRMTRPCSSWMWSWV